MGQRNKFVVLVFDAPSIVDLDDDGGESAGSSAFKSPEEVRVGLGVWDEELAGGGYYFEGEGLVGSWRRVENEKWDSMSEEDA